MLPECRCAPLEKPGGGRGEPAGWPCGAGERWEGVLESECADVSALSVLLSRVTGGGSVTSQGAGAEITEDSALSG